MTRTAPDITVPFFFALISIFKMSKNVKLLAKGISPAYISIY